MKETKHIPPSVLLRKGQFPAQDLIPTAALVWITQSLFLASWGVVHESSLNWNWVLSSLGICDVRENDMFVRPKQNQLRNTDKFFLYHLFSCKGGSVSLAEELLKSKTDPFWQLVESNSRIKRSLARTIWSVLTVMSVCSWYSFFHKSVRQLLG